MSINLSKSSSLTRKKLSKKYYHDFVRKTYFANTEPTTQDLLTIYNKYLKKLQCFIKELEKIKQKTIKETYSPNYRQLGAYERCIIKYPDKGWSKKYDQYRQAYKELMVDALYYSKDLNYEDISLAEIDTLLDLATFLLEQGRLNIKELQN